MDNTVGSSHKGFPYAHTSGAAWSAMCFAPLLNVLVENHVEGRREQAVSVPYGTDGRDREVIGEFMILLHELHRVQDVGLWEVCHTAPESA